MADTHYDVVIDEGEFSAFVDGLPDLEPHEVWYATLFGRHKYDPSFPNTRDSGQLVRETARNRKELKEKVRRMEVPIYSLSRDGAVATQQCLAAYVALNPRCLATANRLMLVEMAKRFADGDTEFNPISMARTNVHRALGRKFFLDFDFDDADPEDYRARVLEILPDPGMFRFLKTRGGFHLVVDLGKMKGHNIKWHQMLSVLPKCDIRGTNTLTPIPGCTQGGFVPRFV